MPYPVLPVRKDLGAHRRTAVADVAERRRRVWMKINAMTLGGHLKMLLKGGSFNV